MKNLFCGIAIGAGIFFFCCWLWLSGYTAAEDECKHNPDLFILQAKEHLKK